MNLVNSSSNSILRNHCHWQMIAQMIAMGVIAPHANSMHVVCKRSTSGRLLISIAKNSVGIFERRRRSICIPCFARMHCTDALFTVRLVRLRTFVQLCMNTPLHIAQRVLEAHHVMCVKRWFARIWCITRDKGCRYKRARHQFDVQWRERLRIL